MNMLPTIIAKSDQVNADDLIGGPRTITITKVVVTEGDQPVSIHFEGDDSKPYKPCKTCRRVLVQAWGDDAKTYPGRRLTIYRDDRVQFGGQAVGGIRISHVSGIDRETTMALMVTRGKRAPYTVRPLPTERPGQGSQSVDLPAILAGGRAAAAKGSAALTGWWGDLNRAEKAASKSALDSELKAAAARIDQTALNGADTETGEIIEADLPGHADEPEDDGFPGDRPATSAAPESVTSKSGSAIAWGKDFLAWIPSASAKVITDAWAEAKREGKTAALQHADPDLFDAVIDAKERRFDALKGTR